MHSCGCRGGFPPPHMPSTNTQSSNVFLAILISCGCYGKYCSFNIITFISHLLYLLKCACCLKCAQNLSICPKYQPQCERAAAQLCSRENKGKLKMKEAKAWKKLFLGCLNSFLQWLMLNYNKLGCNNWRDRVHPKRFQHDGHNFLSSSSENKKHICYKGHAHMFFFKMNNQWILGDFRIQS